MSILYHYFALALSLAIPIEAFADLEKATFEFAKEGYFMAGNNEQQSWRKALSDNYFTLVEGAGAMPSNELRLIALPETYAAFEQKYDGFEVLLVNSTGEDVEFNAVDGLIPVIQEAKTIQGEWREIEHLPSSWCGDSYYTETLRAGHMWKFIAPRYEGTLKAKLRFVLKDGPRELRSNEFDGSVNPKQFKEKEDHTATNMRDPYSK